MPASGTNNREKIRQGLYGIFQAFCILLMTVIVLFCYWIGFDAKLYFIICAVTGLISVVVWWKHRSRITVLLIIVFFSVTIIWPLFGQAPVVKYHRFFWNVKYGMTVDEVMTLFESYYPNYIKEGKPGMLKNESGNLTFILNPSGPGNAEAIVLTIEKSHVTDKIYSPD